MNCADVAALVRPHADPDNGEAAAMLAERAQCSTRTLWRVLSGEAEWLALDRADKMLVAVGESINSCRLLHADGTIEEPFV